MDVGTDQRMVTFDSNFRYIDLTTVQDTITVNETFDANSTVDPTTQTLLVQSTSNTITMGATAATTSVDGSRFIVIPIL